MMMRYTAKPSLSWLHEMALLRETVSLCLPQVPPGWGSISLGHLLTHQMETETLVAFSRCEMCIVKG